MSTVEITSTTTAGTPYPPRSVAWYTTILLAALYWLSILDRFIISLLVDPIKADLGITDIQFAMLHGAAFAIAFSIFGLIAGSLADRLSRRRVIFVSVAVWSLATAACGMAQQFWHLLLARVGVGAGEAGLNPSATSMISDLFPRNRLTFALAVFAAGSSIGSGCAYLFGGYIVTLVSHADSLQFPLVGEIRSWQAVFFIVGIPGIFASVLIFTAPEPVRRGIQALRHRDSLLGNTVQSYIVLWKFIRSRGSFFIYHYLGFGIAAIVVVGSGVWYPAHMGRTFGWDASQIGLALGLTLVTASTLGKLACSYFVDLMYTRGYRDSQFRWYAFALLLSAPCGIIATTSTNSWIFLTGIWLFVALAATLPACATAALNLVTPNDLRGTGIAFYASTTGLVALALGPLLIAFASDRLYGGDAIGFGLATVMAVCCPIGAVILLSGCGSMRDAMAKAEEI